MISGNALSCLRGMYHLLSEVLPSATEPSYGYHQRLAADITTLTCIAAYMSADVQDSPAQTAKGVAVRMSNNLGPRHQ